MHNHFRPVPRTAPVGTALTPQPRRVQARRVSASLFGGSLTGAPTRPARNSGLVPGDLVSWLVEDQVGLSARQETGKIKATRSDGPLQIPGTAIALKGTPDDPAALLKDIIDVGDQKEGDCWYLVPFSKLSKVMVPNKDDGKPGLSTNYGALSDAELDSLIIGRLRNDSCGPLFSIGRLSSACRVAGLDGVAVTYSDGAAALMPSWLYARRFGDLDRLDCTVTGQPRRMIDWPASEVIECSGYGVTWHEAPRFGRFRLGFKRVGFEKELARNRDVDLRLNHDRSMVIARRSDRNLTLAVDDTGLKFTAWLRRSPAAEMLYGEFFGGTISGCSIEWSPAESSKSLYHANGQSYLQVDEVRAVNHVSIQLQPDEPCFQSTVKHLNVQRCRGSW